MTVLCLYLTIGFIVAARSMASGRVGTAGVLPSFIFQSIFWPLFALLGL